MNIFKILANGDGSINEANISAFLGYLLNPYEDHGLGYEFLSRFLLDNFDDESYEIECIEQFDFEVLFEQAFRSKDTNKKDIVDIVILCFKNTPKKGENIVRSILTNKGQLDKIILIENKIKSNSINEKQLSRQYLKTKSTLEELIPNFQFLNGIKTVYISPNKKNKNAKNFEVEFVEFQKEHDCNSENSNHIKWKSDDSEPSIISILKSLISEESAGDIEAINEYTKHTLISFIRYIDNDFKSSFQIKREGKFQKDLFYDFEGYLNKYKDNLNQTSNSLISQFNQYLSTNFKNKFTIRHSKTHPLSVFEINEKKIFSLSTYGKGLKLQVVTRKYKNTKLLKSMLNIIQDRKYEYKENYWGIDIFNINDISILQDIFEDYYREIVIVK